MHADFSTICRGRAPLLELAVTPGDSRASYVYPIGIDIAFDMKSTVFGSAFDGVMS